MDLFTRTIQYLNCLYNQGMLSPAQIEEIAAAALRIAGNDSAASARETNDTSKQKNRFFTDPDEIEGILRQTLT